MVLPLGSAKSYIYQLGKQTRNYCFLVFFFFFKFKDAEQDHVKQEGMVKTSL